MRSMRTPTKRRIRLVIRVLFRVSVAIQSLFLSRGDAHIHSFTFAQRQATSLAKAPFWYHSVALYFLHGSFSHSFSQSILTLTINASLPLGQCCICGLVCLCLFSFAFAFFSLFPLFPSLSLSFPLSLSLSPDNRQEDEKGKPCCVVFRSFLVHPCSLFLFNENKETYTNTYQGGNGWSPIAPSE